METNFTSILRKKNIIENYTFTTLRMAVYK